MIRQFDFLTGFSLRASRATEPMEQPSPKATVDPDVWISTRPSGRARDALQPEPSLDDVLSDPIVRRLMLSDDVKSSELRRVMGMKES